MVFAPSIKFSLPCFRLDFVQVEEQSRHVSKVHFNVSSVKSVGRYVAMIKKNIYCNRKTSEIIWGP